MLLNKGKSILLSISLALIVTFSFGVSSAFAATSKAIMYGSEHSVTSANSIYAAKGSTIYFEWVATKGSVHNVAFGVYDRATGSLVSEAKGVSYIEGSNSFGYYDVKIGGNYYLRAVCGGNSQTGCRGSGFLKND